MKKNNKQIASLEKFKHFKSFYIERTKEYFLCDFYEMLMPDKTISYKVTIELKKVAIELKHIHKQILELHETTSGKWKISGFRENIPFELEEYISNCIVDVCLKKN